MKDIKILHQSCCGVNPNIRKQIEKVANDLGVEVSITDITDMMETMQYGTMDFPSLVVDKQVYSYRQNKSDDAIASLIK